MAKVFKRLETKLIHAGEPEPRIQGAVSMPIFQSANFEYAGETDYHSLKYIRLNNTPNHIALHHKLAAVENAEAALVTASGMAAISTTLLTILSMGDHLLVQDASTAVRTTSSPKTSQASVSSSTSSTPTIQIPGNANCGPIRKPSTLRR